MDREELGQQAVSVMEKTSTRSGWAVAAVSIDTIGEAHKRGEKVELRGLARFRL